MAEETENLGEAKAELYGVMDGLSERDRGILMVIAAILALDSFSPGKAKELMADIRRRCSKRIAEITFEGGTQHHRCR